MEADPITQIHHEKIDSTQTAAKTYIESHKVDKWILITADTQTAGLGQVERKWLSPKGNVYATFIIPFKSEESMTILPYLTLLSSATITQVLENHGFKPKIKWVNDVQLNEKKVSGSLVQTVIEFEYMYALIGIGINVNMGKEELAEIKDQAATSLSVEIGKEVDRDEILRSLKSRLYENVQLFLKNGKTEVVKYYDEHLTLKGQSVKIVTKKDGELVGTFKGIDDNGFALLEIDGKVETVSDGRMFANN
jgi:BirA family biotin operon repressor/biotin-[acetyl-CoA-carboxylase] ligase